MVTRGQEEARERAAKGAVAKVKSTARRRHAAAARAEEVRVEEARAEEARAAGRRLRVMARSAVLRLTP